MRNTRTFLNSEIFFFKLWSCQRVYIALYYLLDNIFYKIWLYAFSVLCVLCLCARLFICTFGHLLGKGWPFGSSLLCLFVSL